MLKNAWRKHARKRSQRAKRAGPRRQPWPQTRALDTRKCRGEHVDSNGENRIVISHSITEILRFLDEHFSFFYSFSLSLNRI
jgi:hypothetical protein